MSLPNVMYICDAGRRVCCHPDDGTSGICMYMDGTVTLAHYNIFPCSRLDIYMFLFL